MPKELPPNAKLVFLVGAPRSGTTWLQLLVSAPAAVATIAETHVFEAYTPCLFSAWRDFQSRGETDGLHHLLPEGEYVSLIRGFLSDLMARILERKPGATIVLEKTPGHALRGRDILSVFPEAYFLHIVRDPRAVVASMRDAATGWAAGWPSPWIGDNCAIWIDHVSAARQISQLTPRYMEVTYEELKRDGKRTLQSIFDWCGVNVSPGETATILSKYSFDRVRGKQVKDAPLPIASMPDGSFRKGEIDSWRSDLSKHEIALVEHMAGHLMRPLGYQPEYATGRGFLTQSPSILWNRIRTGLAWRLRACGTALSRTHK